MILTLIEPEEALAYKDYFINGNVEEIILPNPQPAFIDKLARILGMGFYGDYFGDKERIPMSKLPFKITLGEGVTSIQGLFRGCYFLQEAPMLDTSNITDFSDLFYDCPNLQKVPDYDFSNAKYMSGVFAHCRKLKIAPTIKANKAISLSYCFFNCESLVSVPVLEMESAEISNTMFSNCQKLKNLPVLKCPKLDVCYNMFYNCYELTEINFEPRVSPSSTSAMFYSCQSLSKFPNVDLQKSIDKSRFNRFDICDSSSLLAYFPFKEYGCLNLYYTRNTKFVRAARDTILRNDYDYILFSNNTYGYPYDYSHKLLPRQSVLSGIKELVSIDCDIVFDRDVTDLTGLFKNCKKLRYIKSITILGNVESMESMFEGCESLESVPVFNTRTVTNMKKMFAGCKSLKSVPNFYISTNTIKDEMFRGCKNLKENNNNSILENEVSPVSDLSLKNEVENKDFVICKSDLKDSKFYKHYLVRRIMNNEIESLTLNCNSGGQHEYTLFEAYSFFKRLEFKISFGSNVSSLKKLFYGMKNLEYIKEIDINSNITDFTRMFAGCLSLKEPPLLNLSSAVKTNSMFENCTSLEKVPDLDTSNVVEMNRMFAGCKNLQEAPFLNMMNAKNMHEIFKGCTKL